MELHTATNIKLYEGEEATGIRGGRCVVTTHRLLYLDTVASCYPLSSLQTTTIEFGFLQRSGKLVCHRPDASYFKLSFKAGGRDAFHAALSQSLVKKAWTETASTLDDKRRAQQRLFCPTQAGVGGIIRQQQQQQQHHQALTESAFSDLQTLMDKAKDMVALLARFTDGDASRMQLDMGIANPVTKDNAGGAYAAELARQLAAFVTPLLATGPCALTEVYARFNRARGVALVSPEDLVHAARLLETLAVGMHLKTFPGGLMVIQSDANADDPIMTRLAEWGQRVEWIDALDVSRAWHVSVSLALGYLRMAEDKGLLCRDEALEGLMFYRNRFIEFDAGE